MNKLQVIEHNKQRVLTTQQLAEVYETTTDNIKMNFQRNKQRFIEGRDFYLLKGEQLKQFLQVTNSYLQISSKTRSMYLWTERGANRHSKILDTDKAWQQFDILEETYFKVKKLNAMDMLKLQNKALLEVDERVNTIEQKVEQIEENSLLNPGEYNLIATRVSERIRYIKNAYHLKLDRSQNSELYKAINKDIKIITGVHTRSQLRKKDFEKVLDFINTWEPSKTTLIVIDQMGLDI